MLRGVCCSGRCERRVVDCRLTEWTVGLCWLWAMGWSLGHYCCMHERALGPVSARYHFWVCRGQIGTRAVRFMGGIGVKTGHRQTGVRGAALLIL